MAAGTSTPPPAPSSDQVAVPPPKKGGNKALIIILAVVGVVVLIPIILLLIGGFVLKNKFGTPEKAQKTIESSIRAGTDGKVDLNTKDGSVTIKGENGDSYSATSNNKLPDDFPKEIPFFKPNTVTASATTTTDGKKGWYVTAETSSKKEDVAKFFKDEFAKSDWTNSSTYDSGNDGMISAENTKTGITVSIVYSSADNGKVSVNYTASQK
jgi:cytoskeletal protein RodZ